MIRQVKSSIIYIESSTPNFDSKKGSGIVVARSGDSAYVLTARHVVTYRGDDGNFLWHQNIRIAEVPERAGNDRSTVRGKVEFGKRDGFERPPITDYTDWAIVTVAWNKEWLERTPEVRTLVQNDPLFYAGWLSGSIFTDVPVTVKNDAINADGLRLMGGDHAAGLSGGPYFTCAGQLVGIHSGSVDQASGFPMMIPLGPAIEALKRLNVTFTSAPREPSVWARIRFWRDVGQLGPPESEKVVPIVQFTDSTGQSGDSLEPTPQEDGVFFQRCPARLSDSAVASVSAIITSKERESYTISKRLKLPCDVPPSDPTAFDESIAAREIRFSHTKKLVEFLITQASDAERHFRTSDSCTRESNAVYWLDCRQRNPRPTDRQKEADGILNNYKEASQLVVPVHRGAYLRLARFHMFLGEPCRAADNFAIALNGTKDPVLGTTIRSLAVEWMDAAKVCGLSEARLDKFSREQLSEAPEEERIRQRDEAAIASFNRVLAPAQGVSEISILDLTRNARLRVTTSTLSLLGTHALGKVETAINSNMDLRIAFREVLDQFASESCWPGGHGILDQPLAQQLTAFNNGCRNAH